MKKNIKKEIIQNLKPLPFLLPMTILYVLFMIYPILKGVYVSLHNWNLIRCMDFIGLDNYKQVFTDSNFYHSLGNTVMFVVISVPLIVFTALVLAMLANREGKLQKFMRVTSYLPSMLSVSVVSVIAVFIFQPYTGFLSTFLHTFGLISTKSEIYWLTNVPLAWTVIIAITDWWTVGFYVLLFLSAMQDIPGELYEAAELDGATGIKAHIKITLPMLKPIIGMVLLLETLAAFKLFSQTLLITNGGPGNATRPLMQYIYQTAFSYRNLGYASAMSYVLFAILLVFSIIQHVVSRKGENG